MKSKLGRKGYEDWPGQPGKSEDYNQVIHEAADEMYKGIGKHLVESYSGTIKDENTITLDSVPTAHAVFHGIVQAGCALDIGPGIYLRKDPLGRLYPDLDGPFEAVTYPQVMTVGGRHDVTYKIRGSNLDAGEPLVHDLAPAVSEPKNPTSKSVVYDVESWSYPIEAGFPVALDSFTGKAFYAVPGTQDIVGYAQAAERGQGPGSKNRSVMVEIQDPAAEQINSLSTSDEVELSSDELEFLLKNLQAMQDNERPFMIGQEADLLASIIQKLS